MRFHSLFLLSCALCIALPLHAESLALPENEGGIPPDPVIDRQTVEIEAEQLQVKKDERIEARGKVELRQGEQRVSADVMEYDQRTHELTAAGAVRLSQPGGVMSGPALKLNLESHVGEMVTPEFDLNNGRARGAAQRMYRTGKETYLFEEGSYTTCPAGNDDWLLKMARLDIDRAADRGVAHHAYIEFMGVPILYTPWMDFPLSGGRKTGFLGPVIGSTNSGGSEITLPFYWNIAPNYDATIATRSMNKRGTQFNNEFRYLGRSYSGELNIDVLPDDKLSGETRLRGALQHTQDLGAGFSAALRLHQVSDDAYFRDLANTVASTTQINLVNEGMLAYNGGWWRASARVQRFQTLQDPLAPVTPPYQREPQLSLSAQQVVGAGTLSLQGEYVDFRHPTLPNGQRLVLYPALSYPLLSNQAYYLTPKLGVHATRYVMGGNNAGTLNQANRAVPIFSLDGGMVLERDFQAGGMDYVQTLEPRAFYVKIPYRAQQDLPNFDAAQAEFSFAQMFSENRFLGSDRIGDADMLTLALTSRFFEDAGGRERLRLAVGERFSFEYPQVQLQPQGTSNNRSDILFSMAGKATEQLDLDSLYQYNPNESRTETLSAALHYRPERGKVLNLGYRYTRDVLRYVDVSGQWPLTRRWYGVARWSHSLKDDRTLEVLGGLEYNQDCWTVRFVLQRFATAADQTSTGVFIQLELNDLIRVGADPLAALRQSVPGYTKLNESSFTLGQPAAGAP